MKHEAYIMLKNKVITETRDIPMTSIMCIGKRTLSPRDIIREVMDETELGENIIKIHLQYMNAVVSGKLWQDWLGKSLEEIKDDSK